jgi:hypothetical protein
MHGFSCVALRNSFLLENFLGNCDGVYRIRPATVKGQVSDGLDQLLLGYAVFARFDEVRPELLWTFKAISAAVTRLRSRFDTRSTRLKQRVNADGPGTDPPPVPNRSC